MSTTKALSPHEALEMFKEYHADLDTIDKILSFSEERFIAQYVDFYEGDVRKARRAYHEAGRIKEQITLLWANVKDAVASPYMRDTLFNNIPQSFIDHIRTIPGYNRLFGNLDFIECDHSRSIFGPAAYFVDLMRFIEKHIPQNDPDIPSGHSLEERQPRLFRIPLDHENTYTLIPYIDLINEVLEDLIRTNTDAPYAVLADAKFPMQLPFHLPLEEIRTYLKQLKLSLQEIYTLFGAVESEIAREILALSPTEYGWLEQPIATVEALNEYYYGKDGKDGRKDVRKRGKGEIDDVDIFTEQTGLSRQQLNDLLFLDLSRDEFQAGLSRFFFINNTGDQQGHLWIQENVNVPRFSQAGNFVADLNAHELPGVLRSAFVTAGIALSTEAKVLVDEPNAAWRIWDSEIDKTFIVRGNAAEITVFDEPFDRIENLTPAKLDRIYRFLKLARKLDWSFMDLDWALRSLQTNSGTGKVLYFDGVNDFVAVEDAAALPVDSFTIEAWIQPAQASYNPILAKGNAGASSAGWLFWITPNGQLAFFSKGANLPSVNKNHRERNLLVAYRDDDGANLMGDGQIPHGVFTHVAVTVNERPEPAIAGVEYQLKFYINGLLDATWSVENPIVTPAVDTQAIDLNIGKNLNNEFFHGSIADVRLWQGIRTANEIADNRFKRCTGRETGLLAYWPLVERADLEVPDLATSDLEGNPKPIFHGRLGGDSPYTAPVWVDADLPLDPLPKPISPYAYHFDGIERYVGTEQYPLDMDGTLATMGEVHNLDFSTLTLEAWVETAESGTHPLITKGRARLGQYQYQLAIDEENLLFFSSTSPEKIARSVQPVPIGERVHVAAVVTNTSVTFYLNGELAGTVNETISTATAHGGDLYLGRNFAGEYLKGAMQEVRIWSVPRTQNELRLTRDFQLIGTEPGLVGYWRLNEEDPKAELAHDLTFNQNHLYSGGIAETYRPTLVTHPEVIVPIPVASEATTLHFDERNYAVTVTNLHNHGLGYHEQLTLQFWFQASDPANTARKQLLFSQGDAETGLAIYLFAGQLYTFAWCVPFGGDEIVQQFIATMALNDTNWHQLTFTYDETPKTGIIFRAYVDDVYIAATAPNDRGFRLDQVGPAYLGGLTAETFTRFHDEGVPQVGAHYFAGQLSDLRLWKKAFPEAEIIAPADDRHLRHVPPLDEEDLLCYLPMTEGYGSPVSDHTGPLYEPDPTTTPPPTIVDKSGPIYDQTRYGREGRLYVGPDTNEKWTGGALPLNPNVAYRLEHGQSVTLPKLRTVGILNHDFTIELWVRVDAFEREQALLGTVGPRSNNKTNKGLYLLVTETGQLRAGFYEESDLLSNDVLVAGQWHHIAWRYDKSAKRHALLIDGALQGEADGQGVTRNTDLYLGFWQDWLGGSDWANTHFQGEISELRIWDALRTEQEIADHQQHRLTGSKDGLQAYWIFDQDPRYLLRNHVEPHDKALIEIGANDDIVTKWVESDTPINTANYALQMDGKSDYIDLQEYRLTETGTIELWMKFARDREQILFDTATRDDNLRFSLEVIPNQNNADIKLLRFRVEDATNTAAVARIRLPNDWDEGWHHVAVTWAYDEQGKRVNIQLYLDALARSTDEHTGNKDNSGAKPDYQTFYIGTRQGQVGTNKGLFQGQIRQVRIWDIVRYAGETIDATLRDMPLRGTEAGLQVYLPLNEGRGAILHNLAQGSDAKLEIGNDPDPDVKWVTDDEDVVQSKLVFQFDEDAVVLPYWTSIALQSTSFTVEAWINLPALDGELPILGTRGPKADPTSAEWVLSVVDGVPQIRMAGQLLRADDLPLTVDTWHHLACQYDATAKTLQLLVDGVVGQQQLTALEVVAAEQRLYIGLWRHWNGVQGRWETHYFRGLMAEIRMWSSFRTLAEILRTKEQRLRGNEADLLAYWVFDGEQRDQLDDRSTHERHLSLRGTDDAHIIGTFVPAQPPILVRPQVLTLDGYNDYLTFSDIGIDGGNAWTLAMWVQCVDPERRQILFAHGEHYRALIDAGCLRLEWTNGGGTQSTTTLMAIHAAEWYHLAFASDGSQLQLFAQGVEMIAAPLAALPPLQNADLRVGTDSTRQRDHFFAGHMAELQLWQGARTAEEVADTFWHVLTGREEQLVAYWPLINENVDVAGDRFRDWSDSYGPALLTLGLENPAKKWLPTPSPIDGAISALSLDGKDDYIDLAQVTLPPLTLGTDFTVEAWINVGEIERDQVMVVLGSQTPQADDRDHQVLRVGVRGRKPYLSFYNNSFLPDIWLDAGWHHLAWQYVAASETMRIILDDDTVLEESGHPRYVGNGALYLGRWDDWDPETQEYRPTYFRGLIGEVRVWDAVREVPTIAANRHRRLIGNEEQLIAYWVFDDQNQTIIPSTVAVDDNLYTMILRNDLRFMQPLWETIADYPLLDNPLAREALAFDGWQQYLGQAEVALSLESFTVEAWVRLAAVDPQQANAGQDRPLLWLGHYPDTGPETNISLHVTTDNHVAFTYWNTDTDILETVLSTATLLTDRFTHLAVVASHNVDSNELTLQLLINGNEDTTVTVSGTIRNHGSHLLIGRGEASDRHTYFNGLLQEVRIWQEARPVDDLRAKMFHPLSLLDTEPMPVAYWPLGTLEDGETTPDLAPAQQALVLGGFAEKRIPAATPRPLALTLPPEVEIPPELTIAIPVFNRPVFENRLQRTIEVWFISTQPFAGARQIVYQEGDAVRGLAIYLEDGKLHFAGWNKREDERHWQHLFSVGLDFADQLDNNELTEDLRIQFDTENHVLVQEAYVQVEQPGRRWTIVNSFTWYEIRKEGDTLHVYNWQFAHIATERIDLHHWHHAVIVLDGRDAVQDDAFCALLDGKVVDTRPGSQLPGAATAVKIGGLSFTPVVEKKEFLRHVTDDVITGHWHQTPAGYWHDCKAARGENALHFVHAEESGFYRIAIRYPVDDPIQPRFAAAVPITIDHVGGTTVIELDQRAGGGDYEVLGTFELEQERSSVRIANPGGEELVVFEALQFIPMHFQQPTSDSYLDPTVATAITWDEAHLFGQIKQVRIWETARTRAEILAEREHGLPDDARSALLFYWDTGERRYATAEEPLDRHPLFAPCIEIDLPNGLVPTASIIPLQDLAHLKTLLADTRRTIEQLTALWATVKHTGGANGRTLFDKTFNPTGTPDADRWSYSVRLRWQPNETDRINRNIRARLMSALRVSSTELDALVTVLHSQDAVVILNGETLSKYFRLKLLAGIFRMPVVELVRLVTILNQETTPATLSPLMLDAPKLEDVLRIKQRVDWMTTTGIDLSEYDFLVNNVQDQRVSLPYTEANIVDSARALLNQAREHLFTPQTLASGEIDEATARALYQMLIEMQWIVEKELKFPRSDGDLDLVKLGIFVGGTKVTNDWVLYNSYLFGAGIELADQMDQMQLPISLREQFAKAGYTLTPDALVLVEENGVRWAIVDGDEQYKGRREQNRLNIYAKATLDVRVRDNITAAIQDRWFGLRATFLTALSELLNTDPERLQLLIENTDGQLYGSDIIKFEEFLPELSQIVVDKAPVTGLKLADDLFQLSKILFLLSQFDLSAVEIEALLEKSLPVFGIEPAKLVQPSQVDLNQLHLFVGLRNSFDEAEGRFVQVLEEDLNSLEIFSGWVKLDILQLGERFGIQDDQLNTIAAIDPLSKAFALMRKLGTNVSVLLELATTSDLSFEFYAAQAKVLLDLVRARYDEEQWERVYKPLHDMLAIQKRDSMTAYILEDLAIPVGVRKSPDLLYEYLLLDVQTGSEVDTSRIVQGLASLQLYVQRCLMNLEKGVKPEQIPQDEWEWMKNYRVWEANRKVFLYPENYIEPELRDTKTPLFTQLEEELQQGDVNEESIRNAYTHYLDEFADVADLKIVGSYVHKYVDEEEVVQRRLFLVGRTDKKPRVYYYRTYDVVPNLWQPWIKIDLTIDSDFVTPVFAFGKLFLFWSEFAKLTKSIDRIVPFFTRHGKRLPWVGDSGATPKEYDDVIKNNKSVDPNGFLINELSQERVQENIDIYKPVIKYTYYNFSNTWIPPQTYLEPDEELREETHLRPKWQRVYAQRTLENFIIDGAELPPPSTEGVQVMAVSQGDELTRNVPNFSTGALTWEFWARFENVIAQGLDGTIPETELDNYRHTLQLVQYDDITRVDIQPDGTAVTVANTNLTIFVTNNITRIPNAPDLDAFERNVEAAQVRVSEALEQLANASTPEEKQAAQLALVAAQNALIAAQRELAEARALPQWESRNLMLTVKLGQHILANLAVDYVIWQHLAIVMEDIENSRYRATLYLSRNGAENFAHNFQVTIAGDRLRPRQLLTIGTKEVGQVENRYRVQMSEFRLWNSVRTGQAILATRNERRRNNGVTLFQLALDGQNESITTVGSTLILQEINPPLVEVDERERIIILYGDEITTIRNNLEDANFKLIFDSPSRYDQSYDLNLTLSKLHVTITDGLSVNDYATEDESTLSSATRIAPQLLLIYPLLALFFPQHPLVLYVRALLDAAKQFDDANPLLDKLPSLETTFADVNNQPGWYLLDTGDEAFLIMADRQELQTTAERMRFKYVRKEKDAVERQPVRITIVVDDELRATGTNPPSFAYQFMRLSTYAVHELSENLFVGGFDRLLSLESQKTKEQSFDSYQPNRNLVIAPSKSQIDFNGAHGLYYWEIFFHIPFLIANKLNASQKFAEAQKWYHYIFNPTAQAESVSVGKDRYWRFLPFRDLSINTLYEMLSNDATLMAYRQDPFDPHAIARLRIIAYQKAIVMKYIDNLLDWGDYLFRQDTRESINEALPLYVLAFNLLGPRPKSKPGPRFELIGDYHDVANDVSGSGLMELPDFLIEPATAMNSNGVPQIPFDPNRTVTTRFCVPENAHFIAYWDRVEDRLYKIRHSLNLDGIFRSLALFQPPIDPAALVRAVAGGLAGGYSAVLASANAPVPHYRYEVVLAKAKELTSQLINLGNALLSTLEKKDAEELTLLRHRHELNILNRTLEVRRLAQEQAEASLDALRVSLQSATYRRDHYAGLLEGPGPFGSSALEITEMTLLTTSSILRLIGSNLNTAGGVIEAIPYIEAGGAGFGGSPVAVAGYEGRHAAAPVKASGQALQIAADITSISGQIVGTLANYERRAEDWTLQQTLADHEINQINFQIDAAQLQVEMAEREIQIQEETIRQLKEVGDFYLSKFTSKELYNWMANRLSGLYFQTYKLAFDLAKQAERAFQFEFGTNQSFVNFNYWDSRRKGLMAGETLQLDLARMEKSALDQDSRYLEMTKHISLLRHDPQAFLALKQEGKCQFSFDELLFDRDFPGHYFRIIKSISVSIPAVVGPYQTFKATLTQTGHKTLLEPDDEAVAYLLNPDADAGDMPLSIRVDWRANQQIAISTGVDDSGMFELNFNDSRYLPFEGTGAISNWMLEMPKATNAIDFDTITDVIIHVRYMAKADYGLFKETVMAHDTFRTYKGMRLLSLAHEFSTIWHTYKNDPNRKKLELSLPPNAFPPNVTPDSDTFAISSISAMTSDGNLQDIKDKFTVTWGEDVTGTITMVLTEKSGFKKAETENLLIVMSYEGEIVA